MQKCGKFEDEMGPTLIRSKTFGFLIRSFVPNELSERAIKMKTNTGRKRINILGCLNIDDLTIITTLTEEKCNKQAVLKNNFLQ